MERIIAFALLCTLLSGCDPYSKDNVEERFEAEPLTAGSIKRPVLSFKSPCPENWKMADYISGIYIVGSDQNRPELKLNASGGRASHSHTGNIGSASSHVNADNGGDINVSNFSHTHSFSTNEHDHTPPTISVNYCEFSGIN